MGETFSRALSGPLAFGLAHQSIQPSSDGERLRFVRLFRAAQKFQETGQYGGYEFHTKPRYVLAVESVDTINLTRGRELKPAQAKVIQETICADWRFIDRSNKIVEAPVCDRGAKTIPAKNWSCFTENGKKLNQQEKILKLLKCSPGVCLNHREVKALIPSIRDSRGQLEALWKKGDVRTDTIDRQVVTAGGKQLSWKQLQRIPPSRWNIEIKKRKISPASVRRRRTVTKRPFASTPRSTLTCFRAP